MKRTIITLLTAIALLCSGTTASALDPKDILGRLGAGNSTESSATTDDDSSNESSGGILGALGGFVSNAVANKNFKLEDLNGKWTYTSPAVSFRSENALKNIGGAGAATFVENKLEPYYRQLGFNRTTLTVAEDHTFELALGAVKLKGTIEKDADQQLVFNFSAFGKIKLGKVSANATKAGDTLNLTFDATRFVQLLTKLSSVLKVNTITTLANLLNSYDGIYMGFKLKKAKTAAK